MNQIGVGSLQISETGKKYLLDVIETERLSYGKYHRDFEKEFGELHDVQYAMFCNSGTSALQAGLHALKIKYGYTDGDEVLVPALTFVASVNVILQNNLKPVFVDVDPDRYTVDPKLIEEKITNRTRAIMPVHIGGLPCEMDEIMKIAKKHNLQVIEDSCETMFADIYGKSVGSYGDISCFSTYVAHILTTGVGGFACTNDPELAVIIKSLFNHGRDSIYLSIDDDKGKRGQDLAEVVSKRFRFDHVGYSYRATEFEAALGLGQIKDYKENIQRRKEIAKKLTIGLLPHVTKLQYPLYEHNVFMFYPLVCHEDERDKLVNFLESKSIETRQLLPLTNQPVYKDIVNEEDYPVAKHLNERAFYIGCHPGMTDEDVDYIIKAFDEYYG